MKVRIIRRETYVNSSLNNTKFVIEIKVFFFFWINVKYWYFGRKSEFDTLVEAQEYSTLYRKKNIQVFKEIVGRYK